MTVQQEASPTELAGTATRTDPAGGALVAKASPITLFVSSGPAPVKVPPLENRTEAQARASLSNLGLAVEVTYQAVPIGDAKDGKVIAQSIASGTDVAPGTIVKLKIGKAPPPTTTAPTTEPPTTVPITAAPTTTTPATTTTPSTTPATTTTGA